MAMKIIGIVSGKGGVGKTTTVTNLSVVLARDYKKRVLAVDGNILAPNLGLHFGIYHYSKTLTDVVRGTLPVEEAIQAHPCGVHILSATPSVLRSSDIAVDFRALLRSLKDYDYVIVDTAPSPSPAGFPSQGLSPILELSEEILVVTNPDYPSVVDAKRAIEVAKTSRVQIRGVLLNRYRRGRWGLSPMDIQYVCEVPVVSVIPERDEVGRSISSGVPVVLGLPRSPAAIEFRRLAAFLQGEHYTEGWRESLANFLWYRRRVSIEARLRRAPVPPLPAYRETPPAAALRPPEHEVPVVERPLMAPPEVVPPPPPSIRLEELEKERDQVAALLSTLEKQRERGYLPEAVYQKLKGRAEARFRDISRK